MALIVQITFAQQRTVSGTVTDANGLPLPGVSVLKKGTTEGAQTDLDGKFQLQAAPSDVLTFTFIGMKTKELPATSASFTVKLEDDAQELETVVVTALGIKREKKALGYSTTTINKDQLTNVVNSNPFESLSGKIAGVDISAPGQPGASSKIIIRGFGSITGNNDPLYVVDGTPINNSSTGNTTGTRSYDGGNGVNDLDPNNIETLTVLKGAAATALYGSRAGNGVIIITTKRGKNQSKINVDFLSSIEMNEVARVPHLQNEFGQGWNGEGFSALSNGLGPSNENGSWGPKFNGEVRPWGTVYNNTQQIKPYSALKDNVKDFYDIGTLQTNSVSISGGSDFSDFALTFSNLSSDGVIPTDADRYVKRNLSFNGGLKNEKVSVRASINYANKEQSVVNTGQGDDAGEGSTLQQDLLQIPRDVSILDMANYQGNPFNSPSYYFTPYSANPFFGLNENSTKISGHNLFGNVNFNYQITPELSAAWQVGGNYRIENLKSYGAIVNYLTGSPQDLASTNPVVGGVTERRIERSEFDTYFNLNYNKKLSEKFNLNALVGFNYNQQEANSLFASITGLDVPNFYEITNSANRPTVAQANQIKKTFGFYAQAELAFDSKYFLTLTARNDKNSTLPVDNNSYFYPGASVSALLIDNSNTFLKLRAGMAQVGRGTEPYLTESSLIVGSAAAYNGTILAPLGGVNYYELGGILGNLELKPEMTTESEVGLEGNLFGNRVSFDVSLYHRKTTDLIVLVPLDPSTGYGSQSQNIGDIVNKGIELTLGFTPIKTQDFSWNLNYTFTKNDNEVTKVEGNTRIPIVSSGYGITMQAEQGRPVSSFYGRVPLTNDAGQYIVNPDTGYYVVSDEDRYLGNGQRDFVMGLQNTFKYKNISLNFAFDWKQGGEMYSYTKRLSHFVGNGIETTFNDRNTFIIPNSVIANGDGTFSENTTPITTANITNYWGNTSNNPGIERGHLIDKTFVRLRDLNLTYSFSPKIVEQLGLTKLSIGLYGKNLFMWTPDDNPYVDPETTTYGNGIASELGEFGTNPSQRAYGATVKLSF